MNSFLQFRTFHRLLKILISSVWIFHGFYSKILDGVPRHRQIVSRILGEAIAGPGTLLIGIGEIGIGLWVLAEFQRRLCAGLQTFLLVSMNLLEIRLASDLLISPHGMVALNLCFTAAIWCWAIFPDSGRVTGE
ncbi:MAG: DoxX-like family protein [Luteolibacter sp.]